MYKIKIKDVFYVNKETVNLLKYDFINYLDTGNITKNQIDFLQKLDTNNSIIPSRAKRIVKQNTIIYSSVRPNKNHYGIIRKPEKNMVASTGFITLDLINEELFDVDYLYYNLTQDKYTNYLQSIACNNVSSYPSINPSDLEDMIITINSNIEVQKQIGKLLYMIDEKIELNNKINCELESLAKMLYDYWFVQFDFPDESERPYKSSGGKMVWNDEMGKYIPDGFEIIQLKKICEIKSGFPFSSNSYCCNGKYKLITIKNVLNNYISTNTENYINEIPLRMPDYCLLKERNVLLSLTGDVGRIGIVYESNLLLNQRVGLLKVKDDKYNFYVYLMFLSDSFRTILKRISTGSNQKNLSPIETEKLLIIFSQQTIDKFNKYIQPIIDLTIKNYKENISLTSLRDYLLPLLMNGQVSVNP